MYITYHTKYLLHKRRAFDTAGLSIRLRVTLKGQRPLDFSTGITADVSQWDVNTQHIKRGVAEAAKKNRTLDDYMNAVDDIMNRYELVEKRVPTLSELKNEINEKIGRERLQIPESPAGDIFAALDLFMETRGAQNQWSPCTFKRFRTLKNRLYEFDPFLSFRDITEDKLQEFVTFLGRYNLHNTTMAKNVRNLRWFLRWCAGRNLYKGTAHETFRPHLKGSDGRLKEIIYLTPEEIKRLQEQTLPEALDRVRDIFLFCCFSGLRYSDARKLKKSDIKEGYIRVVTKKTSDSLKIELNDHSAAILKKYENERLPDGAALPVISNQKMNDHLKEIGRTCGFDTPVRNVYFTGNVRHENVLPKWAVLSTHCARRTFVVTALTLGIPSEVIMKWTGHSDFDAMKPYVAIVDDLKAREMSLFNRL